MIYEHHEDAIGTGFPRGIEKSQQHPLSQIIYTADSFCHLVTKSPKNQVKLVPAEALKKLKQSKKDQIEDSILEALEELILKSDQSAA